MPDLDIYASGLAVLLGLAVAGWLASLALRDASLADPLWPLNFILLTASQLILAKARTAITYNEFIVSIKNRLLY